MPVVSLGHLTPQSHCVLWLLASIHSHLEIIDGMEVNRIGRTGVIMLYRSLSGTESSASQSAGSKGVSEFEFTI
jgi:hypothetical protein